jgi:hypothetical protein
MIFAALQSSATQNSTKSLSIGLAFTSQNKPTSSTKTGSSSSSSHQRHHSQSHLEAGSESHEELFENILETLRKNGYPTFDEAVKTYYTHRFREDSAVHFAQQLSRQRHLSDVLKSIISSTSDWTSRDSYCITDQILRSTEAILATEMETLARFLASEDSYSDPIYTCIPTEKQAGGDDEPRLLITLTGRRLIREIVRPDHFLSISISTDTSNRCPRCGHLSQKCFILVVHRVRETYPGICLHVCRFSVVICLCSICYDLCKTMTPRIIIPYINGKS